MNQPLSTELENQLLAFAQRLVNPQAARIAIRPQADRSGYWFGGGNLVQDADGNLYLVGRYRNHGDSRTGFGAGERGLELAIFRSTDQGESFDKVVSLPKQRLNLPGQEVLSIEGSALRIDKSGVELFVSTEKSGIGYPPGLEEYLKPGAGVWTIDRLSASSVNGLQDATVHPLLSSRDPEYLHWKDPAVYCPALQDTALQDTALQDTVLQDTVLLFCTHPYSWSSSNTAFALRPRAATDFEAPNLDFFPRGTTWDVAMTRGTCLMDVPPLGPFAERRLGLLFYDGGESLRDLAEHSAAVSRPRGYSCEELGGVAYFIDGQFDRPHRLSRYFPTFLSPHGTRCCRYVDVLTTRDGFYVTWQQSQPDGSQPLMLNFVPFSSLQDA